MNYELVDVIQADSENWRHQQARGLANDARLITLAPDPSFIYKKGKYYQNAVNLVDLVTKRTLTPGTSLFFDKVPTIDGAEVFMNPDGIISIIDDGIEVGEMTLYEGTRRFVKDVTYFNNDGSRDYKEEYAFDGKLFSYIYYWKDKVQQIAFVNDNKQIILRFYFYEGSLNLVTIEDPQTQVVTASYSSMAAFAAFQVGKLVNKDDTVHVTYLGLELEVLRFTDSKNIVNLDESPFDDSGVLKGNLKMIIDGTTDFIDEIDVSREWYEDLKDAGTDLSKVRAIKEHGIVGEV